VVRDQHIEPAKAFYRSSHQRFGCRSSPEISLHSMAEVGSELGYQAVCISLRAHVVEDDTSPGLDKQADGGSANAARPSGDERDAPLQGESNVGHGFDCSGEGGQSESTAKL
jgi:hypothetical protein